jgi:glycosyltransferase involved in cell wall biosynthesis
MDPATPSPRIALVVPCFNEAERLDAGAFIGFARERADRRLCFVDDGSTDATAARLAEIAAAVPDRIDIERMPTNRGKGAAVRAGLRAQLARAPRYVGYWDADLATPLPFVETLAAHLDVHADLALAAGSRVLMLGRPIQRRAARHYLGRVAATLVSLVLRAPIYDSQCGAKLLRNGPGLSALLDAPFATRWLFDVEILDRIARGEAGEPAAVLHRRVHEVPVPTWVDAAGSKVRLADWLRVPLDLARIWRARRAR